MQRSYSARSEHFGSTPEPPWLFLFASKLDAIGRFKRPDAIVAMDLLLGGSRKSRHQADSTEFEDNDTKQRNKKLVC